MIFRFGKDGISGISGLAAEVPPNTKNRISGISGLATEVPPDNETPFSTISNISRFSSVSDLRDKKRKHTHIYINNRISEGTPVANPLNLLIEDRDSTDTANQGSKSAEAVKAANRKILTEVLKQATDGIRFIELGKHPLSNKRMTPAMLVTQLTKDDIKGIIEGEYDVALIRCAAESMARFPSECTEKLANRLPRDRRASQTPKGERYGGNPTSDGIEPKVDL